MASYPGPKLTSSESHADGLARSRAALLHEIGTGHDLTFVTGPGNIGDELIWAGTRELLRGRVYREIGADELAKASGDTVLMTGGAAWCRPYHEWMPHALAVAELRFGRVIVLPSSFDVSEDIVRETLERTSATVFAREHESLRHIEGMCRARLAHDCAFFFDFSQRKADGIGTLNAFRTDPEKAAGEPIDADNDDISVTAGGLEAWLDSIERHAHVRTDRAHVMIAAALMGKPVEFASSAYVKVDALAASWLKGFPVSRIEAPRAAAVQTDPLAPLRARLCAASGERPRITAVSQRQTAAVTAVVLTRDRHEHAATAVHSALRAGVPLGVILLANNPSRESREALARIAKDERRIDLHVLDRNLGCAGGRRLASELVTTEYVLFLDDDAELIDGALERMLETLQDHPETVGVSPVVVAPDGSVQHCGGWIEWSDDSARFTHGGARLPFDDPGVPASGPSGWLPGTAALIRATALRETPIDTEFDAYYEDNDWSFRVERRRPGSFRSCREALVLHHGGGGFELPPSCELARVFAKVRLLAAQAKFLHRHGVVLDIDLELLVPELKLPGGDLDLPAARLLLHLVEARGVDWVATEWLGGGLAPLLERSELAALDRAATEREARHAAELAVLHAAHAELSEHVDWLMARHETLVRVENGGWWRMRTRVQPILRLAVAGRRAIDARRSRCS